MKMPDTPSVIALAAVGVAALWVYNQNAERTKAGSAANPVPSDTYYVNPWLCALTGQFCYAKDSAGTTDTVPTDTPYQQAWTEDPTTYWMKAKKAGMALVDACKARAPTQMQYDLCMQAGW
jgi:hypothetical protein